MRKIRMIQQTPGESLRFEAQRMLSFHDTPEGFSDFPLCYYRSWAVLVYLTVVVLKVIQI